MLMRWITAGALAGGLVAATLASPSMALPAAKADASGTPNIILVDRNGGGRGFGGGRMGGGGGAKFSGGGGGGGGFAMRGPGGGGGPGRAMRALGGAGGGGSFAMRPPGGGMKQYGMKQFQGGSGPRFNNRGDGGPKWSGNWSGQKFGGKFKNHYAHKHNRRFRGYAFYGFPYYYGYSSFGSCDWLYRRAINTSSPYWWDRYYACRDGYYDY